MSYLNKDLISRVQGHGVVGPMCSQDSGGGSYHIVYKYLNTEVSKLIQGITPAGCSTLGKSTGTCGWYGDWELAFADLAFNGSGLVTGLVAPPTYVKMRSIAGNPFTEITGATGTIGPAGSVTTILDTAMSTPFLSAMVGSGISITDAATGQTVNTSITSLSGQTATLGFPYNASYLAAGNLVTFNVVHNVYYEPH